MKILRRRSLDFVFFCSSFARRFPLHTACRSEAVPIEDIGRCEDCAQLFIVAENEELFDNEEHAIAAFKRAIGVKKLVAVKGISHYGIYTKKRRAAQQLAIHWFHEHLQSE